MTAAAAGVSKARLCQRIAPRRHRCQSKSNPTTLRDRGCGPSQRGVCRQRAPAEHAVADHRVNRLDVEADSLLDANDIAIAGVAIWAVVIFTDGFGDVFASFGDAFVSFADAFVQTTTNACAFARGATFG